MKIRIGIDNLLRLSTQWMDRRLALFTNASGVNSSLNKNLNLLINAGFNVVKLFGPEHGISGMAADGVNVPDDVEPNYKIPIFSLYGKTRRPTSEMLEGIDVVIYDIQDVGLRFYTYIYSLAYMMEECGKRGIKVIVLDRPNPLSGKIEGPVIKKSFESFVGGYGLALRYGLTVGELARYFNDRFSMNVDLEVVAMDGWKHWMYYDDTGLLWDTPSPNIPSLEHALLYAGMCLLEGINVSVGRGTVHPFKYVGAPWIDSRKLKDAMKATSHPGVEFRERDFIPLTSKYANEVCHGLEFFVIDKAKIKPLELVLELISTLKKIHTEKFEWDISHHGANESYHFDLLIGDDKYRKAIDEGKSVQELSEMWRTESRKFQELSKKYWLYSE